MPGFGKVKRQPKLLKMPMPFFPSRNAFKNLGFVFHPHKRTAPNTMKVELPAGWRSHTSTCGDIVTVEIFDGTGMLRACGHTYQKESNIPLDNQGTSLCHCEEK